MTSHTDPTVSDWPELETLWRRPPAEPQRPVSRWSPEEQAAHRAAAEEELSGWRIPGEAAERRRAYGRADARVRKLYRLLKSTLGDRTAQGQGKVAHDG